MDDEGFSVDSSARNSSLNQCLPIGAMHVSAATPADADLIGRLRFDPQVEFDPLLVLVRIFLDAPDLVVRVPEPTEKLCFRSDFPRDFDTDREPVARLS